MLEGLTDRPGDELLSLVRELLDLDRHRKKLAGRKPEIFSLAAALEAEAKFNGKPYRVHLLAKRIGVSTSTIVGWRKQPSYQDKIREQLCSLRASAYVRQRLARQQPVSFWSMLWGEFQKTT